MEEEKFDYAAAIAELEEIAGKVEDPETKLSDIVQEKIDSLEDE